MGIPPASFLSGRECLWCGAQWGWSWLLQYPKEDQGPSSWSLGGPISLQFLEQAEPLLESNWKELEPGEGLLPDPPTKGLALGTRRGVSRAGGGGPWMARTAFGLWPRETEFKLLSHFRLCSRTEVRGLASGHRHVCLLPRCWVARAFLGYSGEEQEPSYRTCAGPV